MSHILWFLTIQEKTQMSPPPVAACPTSIAGVLALSLDKKMKAKGNSGAHQKSNLHVIAVTSAPQLGITARRASFDPSARERKRFGEVPELVLTNVSPGRNDPGIQPFKRHLDRFQIASAYSAA
ncbi:hypothetical protein ACTXT7_008356 [Hymenolepis weldensis]